MSTLSFGLLFVTVTSLVCCLVENSLLKLFQSFLSCSFVLLGDVSMRKMQ